MSLIQKKLKLTCLVVFVFVFQPEGTSLLNFVSGYASWCEYLQSMVKDGTWGDHVVLFAAANHFQTPIRIISSLDCEIVVQPDHALTNTTPLVLGHIHELHYVSLQPRQGKTFFLFTKILFFFFGPAEFIYIYQQQRTLQDDDDTINVSMRIKFTFFLNNKLSLLNLNILVV